MSARRASWWRIGLAGASLAGFAGCHAGDPLDTQVDAHTAAAFVLWRSAAISDFTKDQWRQFDEATKELKYQVMAGNQYHGAAIEDAFRDRIDGKTFRAVLCAGLQAELVRKREDRNELEGFIRNNVALKTYEGDSLSADYLKAKRQDQIDRLRKAVDAITTIRGDLAALGFPETGAETPVPPIPTLQHLGTEIRPVKPANVEEVDGQRVLVMRPVGISGTN